MTPEGSFTFFVDGKGTEKTETYTRKEGKGNKDDKKKKKGPDKEE